MIVIVIVIERGGRVDVHSPQRGDNVDEVRRVSE